VRRALQSVLECRPIEHQSGSKRKAFRRARRLKTDVFLWNLNQQFALAASFIDFIDSASRRILSALAIACLRKAIRARTAKRNETQARPSSAARAKDCVAS